MDIAVESDIYEPYMDETNNYIDLIPPSNKFIHGLRWMRIHILPKDGETILSIWQ